MYRLYLLIMTIILCNPHGELHSESKDLTSCAIQLRAEGYGGVATGTAIFAKYGTKPDYYIITAYHNVYRKKKIKLAYFDDFVDFKEVTSVTEEKEAFYCDPAKDLAIFRCSSAGRKILETEFQKKAVSISSKRRLYARIIVVGNSRLDFFKNTLNFPATAGIIEYCKFSQRFPKTYVDSKAMTTEIMILDSIHVTHGFSGGPILYTKSGFEEYAPELAGMIIAGIPRRLRSWAIPSESIVESITNPKNRFEKYPPEKWLPLLIKLEWGPSLLETLNRLEQENKELQGYNNLLEMQLSKLRATMSELKWRQKELQYELKKLRNIHWSSDFITSKLSFDVVSRRRDYRYDVRHKQGDLVFYGSNGFRITFTDDNSNGAEGGDANGVHITNKQNGNIKAGSSDFVLGAFNRENSEGLNYHSSGIVAVFNRGVTRVSFYDTDDDTTPKTLFAFDRENKIIGKTSPGSQKIFEISTAQTKGKLIYKIEFDTEPGTAGGSNDGTVFTIDDFLVEYTR